MRPLSVSTYDGTQPDPSVQVLPVATFGLQSQNWVLMTDNMECGKLKIFTM